MAVLRVSSYRKLFEDDGGSLDGGSRTPCAGQARASLRGAAVDKCHCDCDEVDFEAAKALGKEGRNRFVQDRNVIAALNDRLVGLIELARCFEEENESLDGQIVELEKELSGRPASSSSGSAGAGSGYGLDAVVERLRRERDEILCDTEDLKKELERLMRENEKAAEQRMLLQHGRRDVAEEVDAVTAECLALREQATIYEEQLAHMEDQHTTCDCGAASSAVSRSGDGKQLEGGGAGGRRVRDVSKMKDGSEMKTLISELQKELAELELHNETLEDEVEMKTTAYMDQIAELECTTDEMQHQEADFKVQTKEQCEDYKELLGEKMARDMEIAAYRSLVEEEEARLCDL
ncbi:Vimentin [Liparis tanakae]|uniref:Vimentin n=1 Tax=Liparis tanakae TaxID=230148 RepID=A0A4Z2HEI5_9TELE|nr:Vimentin [Liparis tanakae]